MEDFKIGDKVITVKKGEGHHFHPEIGFEFIVISVEDKSLYFERDRSIDASRCKLLRPVEFDQNPHTCHQEKTILDKAKEIIYGDREKDYGTVTENFGRISALWTIYLDGRSTIEPKDVGMMMILMKVAREMNGHKEDNLVDLAGYAGTIEKLNKGL